MRYFIGGFFILAAALIVASLFINVAPASNKQNVQTASFNIPLPPTGE